ncbi:zinc-ribbon domain-containing protein [Rheinheimera sp. A13L]|uniref:zinc-ribbon domain-containing protein n=1 Tax=Rheinheimera sp. A13L TaxID=506534 RepID=UPI00058FA7DD|nr:zinc-ribbon domain-containing protein [Rheinheimera sp. A13L]
MTTPYVNHPRYGNLPIPSEFSFTADEIEKGHWRYSTLRYLSNTAIPADTSKQYFAIYPRSIYVDIEEQCELCGRLFLFYALEQKYWFEKLQFWIDAHCTRCITCRQKNQNVRKMQKCYQELMKKVIKTERETTQLKAVTLELYQLGYIKDTGKINHMS